MPVVSQARAVDRGRDLGGDWGAKMKFSGDRDFGRRRKRASGPAWVMASEKGPLEQKLRGDAEVLEIAFRP